MNKVFGEITLYSPIRTQGKRTIVSYDFKEVGDEVNATWYEIYFSQRVSIYPNLDTIKESIIKDINERTDEKILSGFVWNDVNIWLSAENQRNFSEAQRVAQMTNGASLPVKFKLGEDDEGNPIYHTFNTIEELNEFYLSAVAYIQQCLNEGWELKDSIDWNKYDINKTEA